MPLQIDEVSAEVERPETPAPAPSSDPNTDQPEVQFRRQCDLLARVATRAARLRAD
jgi:hypothetical protein